MHPNATKRLEILAHLYEQREASPKLGWCSEFDLKQRCGDVAFCLAVLIECGHIQADGPRYRIAGAGILIHEATLT